MKPASQPKLIIKEMGFTHKEFLERLSRLLYDTPYTRIQNLIQFEYFQKRVEILMEEERPRILSRSVQIYFTPITIRLFQFTEDESQAFIEKFNLCFLKGGG